MIFWHLGPHLAKRGWENANQLASGAGLTKPAAYRVFEANQNGTAIQRIDVDTLEALARAFRVKPWALLVYRAD